MECNSWVGIMPLEKSRYPDRQKQDRNPYDSCCAMFRAMFIGHLACSIGADSCRLSLVACSRDVAGRGPLWRWKGAFMTCSQALKRKLACVGRLILLAHTDLAISHLRANLELERDGMVYQCIEKGGSESDAMLIYGSVLEAPSLPDSPQFIPDSVTAGMAALCSAALCHIQMAQWLRSRGEHPA